MSLTVDLHHHAVPDFYLEASNEDGEATGGVTPPRWSAAERFPFSPRRFSHPTHTSITNPACSIPVFVPRAR